MKSVLSVTNLEKSWGYMSNGDTDSACVSTVKKTNSMGHSLRMRMKIKLPTLLTIIQPKGTGGSNIFLMRKGKNI